MITINDLAKAWERKPCIYPGLSQIERKHFERFRKSYGSFPVRLFTEAMRFDDKRLTAIAYESLFFDLDYSLGTGIYKAEDDEYKVEIDFRPVMKHLDIDLLEQRESLTVYAPNKETVVKCLRMNGYSALL